MVTTIRPLLVRDYRIDARTVDTEDESKAPTGHLLVGSHPQDIEDIEINVVDGMRMAFIIGGDNLYVYDVLSTGALSFVNAYPSIYESLGGYYGQGGLDVFTSASATELISVKGSETLDAGASFYSTTWLGTLNQVGTSVVDSFDLEFERASDTVSWRRGDKFFFASASSAENGFTAFECRGGGDVVMFATGNLSTSGAFPSQPNEIEHAAIGGTNYLFLGGRNDSAVFSVRLGAVGGQRRSTMRLMAV